MSTFVEKRHLNVEINVPYKCRRADNEAAVET
jgi:hypothetical protein